MQNITERTWLLKRLARKETRALLWKLKGEIFDVFQYDPDSEIGLAFVLPKNYRTVKNKKQPRTIIPLVSDITGTYILVWHKEPDEYWVYTENGKRLKQFYPVPKNNPIKFWIQNNLKNLKEEARRGYKDDNEIFELRHLIRQAGEIFK